MAYYINLGDSEVHHLSYVIISDCLHHDTISVFLFQKCFIAFLKAFLHGENQLNKIKYFSDGASSQYKNQKNFHNLCLHKVILGYQPSGIIQPPHMAKELVMVLVEQ